VLAGLEPIAKQVAPEVDPGYRTRC
jgi:hypothetical protein